MKHTIIFITAMFSIILVSISMWRFWFNKEIMPEPENKYAAALMALISWIVILMFVAICIGTWKLS